MATKRRGRAIKKVVMREVGMAYSKSDKDGILFRGEIGRVRVCKDDGLNVTEFISGIGTSSKGWLVGWV